MTPEPNPESPLFPERLEAALLHGPVADVTELLHSAHEASYVRAAIGLDQAIRCFEDGQPDELVMHQIMECFDRPEVMARCLYELEQRDRQRGLDILTMVDQHSMELRRAEEFGRMFDFLKRLRERDDPGSDGGAGDREPRLPHDPNDTDGIALERSDPADDVRAIGISAPGA